MQLAISIRRARSRGKARRQTGSCHLEAGEASFAAEGRLSPLAVPEVILTSWAPYRGSIPADHLVASRARQQPLPWRVAQLRHALASEMLRRGSDLVEISQVLRHRDLASTSVYAKVDRAALRTVARPWPGAGR